MEKKESNKVIDFSVCGTEFIDEYELHKFGCKCSKNGLAISAASSKEAILEAKKIFKPIGDSKVKIKILNCAKGTK